MALFASNGEGPFLRRVLVRNFKSIAKCDVGLGKLTVLVGRNGAGKSSFLDAMRFVADSLQTSLDHAFRSRFGIDAVRRKSTGHPRNFAIELQVDLPDFSVATYGFEIASREKGRFAVKQERLRILDGSGQKLAHYSVEEGRIVSSSAAMLPPSAPDRLFLVVASALAEFRPVYESLLSMGFYNLNPDAMKELQSPDSGELLHRDGSNIASVIARLSEDEPDVFARIKEYLETIVPGIKEVNRLSLGPGETLEFRQSVKGSKYPWKFFASSMSDGTLRALGALTAATQLSNRTAPVSLVGIEEPETALHPAAAGALMGALREAASRTQVVFTTHSPDLLDQVDPDTDNLLVVDLREGTTRIARPDPASRDAIKNHLYTPGELLRMNQLEPDQRALRRQNQLSLFEPDREPV